MNLICGITTFQISNPIRCSAFDVRRSAFGVRPPFATPSVLVRVNLHKALYTPPDIGYSHQKTYIATMRHDNPAGQTPSAELQLAGLIARLEPKNQKLIKSLRRELRKRFPAVNELVYDYTRSLVISYSPNERGSDGIVGISGDANGVRLFFNQGVSIPDPQKILQGDGRQTRYIRIEASKVLLRPEVESLLTAAAGKATIPLARSGRGELIIKSSKQPTKSRSAKPRGKKPNS